MEKLEQLNSLVVTQIKEWGEILTGFETKNKYLVKDNNGNDLYYAAEEGGSLFHRLFLNAYRPFTLVVLSKNGDKILSVKRPFRFIYHEAKIIDTQGIMLGTLKNRFTLFRREYSVLDNAGREIYQLLGPALKPWTFFIKNKDKEYGKITKEWSGFLKEVFTEADNFGIVFPAEWDVRLKALFLGAVFLIDFVHFENKGDSSD